MANVLTYNQIITLLQSIAERHYQINSFFLGRDWDLENDRDLQYPVFQVYPETATMPINAQSQYSTIVTQLNMKVFDLTYPGQENERDVHSDTLQIAQDIVNELNQHPFYQNSNLSLVGDIQFNAFQEFKDDKSAGWQFSLNFQQINNNQFCGLPIEAIPGFSATGATSSGVYVNTEFLTCATLPACQVIIDIEAELANLSAETLTQVLINGNQTGNRTIEVNNVQYATAMASITNDFAIGAGNDLEVYAPGGATIKSYVHFTPDGTALTFGAQDGTGATEEIQSNPGSGTQIVSIDSTNNFGQIYNSAVQIDMQTLKGDGTLGAELKLKSNTQSPDLTYQLSGFDNSANANKGSHYFDAFGAETVMSYGLFDNSAITRVRAKLGSVQVGSTGPGFAGAVYDADYSLDFLPLSLINKAYADATYLNAASGNYVPLSGTLTGHELTGAIVYNFGGPGGTALVSTTANYYIGAGDNISLGDITSNGAYTYYDPIGAVILASVSQPYYGSINIDSAGQQAIIYTMGNLTTGDETDLNQTTDSFVISAVTNTFLGLSYEPTTAGYVSTNGSDYTIFNRLYNDLRYAPIAGGAYLPLAGGTMTGTIDYEPSSNNTTALVSTTQNYFIGIGNNADLQSASKYAYLYFTNPGTTPTLTMEVTDSTAYDSSVSVNNTAAGLAVSNYSVGFNNSFSLNIAGTMIIASDWATYAGLQYGSTTVAAVSAYGGNDTIFHRAYNDLRYAVSVAGGYMPISGGTFTGNINGVTPTELSYLSGAVSNIQNQINNLGIGIGGWKAPARVLVSTNVSLTAPGSTLDGVSINNLDRIVLNGQSTPSQNGVYIWHGASSTMTRPTDCSTGDYSNTGVLGMVITIEEGTSADQMWILATDAPITIGSTSLTYIKGSMTTYTASSGITLSGNNFTLNNSYFTGDATISAGVISIGAGKVTNTMLVNNSITIQGTSTSLGGSINIINGNGFVKASGTTISYDNSTYLTGISGTANRISVTGTAIDIASTYVGQTSITTLGTVTTGTLSTGSVIGGATMTLGSDASYDIYYRNSSGILTRLANGTTGQVLTATTSNAPSWEAAAGNPFSDATALVKNATDATKLAIFSLAGLSASNTRTYTMPDVSTKLLGQTGSNSANWVPYFNDANQVTGITNFQYIAASSFLQIGGSAPISTTKGISIIADGVNRALSINCTITTGSAILSFDANGGNDNAFILHNGTAVSGNLAGTSIPFAKLFEIQNGGGPRVNPVSVEGSRVYMTIGNTSTNSASVQDAVGFRIGLMSDVHTTNLNGFTNETKSYFGGNTTATALIHLAAGTATAATAPLKFTSGVAKQTALEAGAINYDGTNIYISDATLNYNITKSLAPVSAVLDFPNTAAQTSSDLTITVAGALSGDIVNLGVPNTAIISNSCYTAWVSANDTVTVRFNNYDGLTSKNPASATFKVSVDKA